MYGFRYDQPQVIQSTGALAIDYVNKTPFVMKSIEFGLIANGRLVADVRDVGTFSPNVEGRRCRNAFRCASRTRISPIG